MKRDPNYLKRIHVIEGYIREIDAGISEKDKQTIIDNVDIIIHAAADVRFDVSLEELTLVNLRGTRELLKIAEQVKQLQMFVYVSTAFSHCYQENIDEIFYECPFDPDKMIKLVETMEQNGESDILEIITDSVISPWPNTYTFTKALSEEIVRRYGTKIPTIVIRPSIGKCTIIKHKN